jgi:hypothetical protein
METDEKHFNELQQKIRAIASTWILTGFGGIAFFIDTSGPTFVYFSSFSIINLIGLMVVIGLFLLWILDQLVYQRLLNANFVAGLYEEHKNKHTAPIRTLMVIGSEYKGMTRLYNLYYFIPMLTFTLISTASLLIEIFSKGGFEKTAPASLILGISILIITLGIWNYIGDKKRSIPFTKLIEAFDDKDFSEFSSQSDCVKRCNIIVKEWDLVDPKSKNKK